MRAYFFAHAWLSQIQRGIQAQHCTVNLFKKYDGRNPEDVDLNRALYMWAEHHETTILLNGGNSASLQQILDSMKTQNQHPFAYFNEDRESLNNTMTCVGIVLPERVYDSASMIRAGDANISQNPISGSLLVNGINRVTPWELEFIQSHLIRCPLA